MERVIDTQLRSADLIIPHNAGTASSQQLGQYSCRRRQNAKILLLPFLFFFNPLVGDYNRFHIEKVIHVHSCAFDWLPFNSGVNNFLGMRSEFKDMLLGPKTFKLRANLRNSEPKYW
jgi:hypothetical protein